mgnify:CR=1 FL=1
MRVKTTPFFIVFLLGIGVFAYLVHQQLLGTSSTFPVGKNFIIEENESLRSISERLEEEGYINSAILFRAGVSFLDKDKNIQLGSYSFDKPLNLLGVTNRLIKGSPDAPLLSVTIPEGSTSFEVATLIAKVLPSISVDIFGETISKYNADGKLFPSTYFLLPSYKEEDIVKLMTTTFTKKVGPLLTKDVIEAPLQKEEDVLTLASILEGEAKTQEDMQIVAGILLARLTIGMPLQVDVAMETYKQRGLPFMPINNPGLVAINAALTPIKTAYLYYITGNDGKMYYAKTFEEHKKNIKKYLK